MVDDKAVASPTNYDYDKPTGLPHGTAIAAPSVDKTMLGWRNHWCIYIVNAEGYMRPWMGCHPFADAGPFAGLNSEALARLFAAAPETAAERDRLKAINADLLAALNAFLNARSIDRDPKKRLRMKPHEWEATEAQARAAVAKANGDQGRP